jgi:glucokinase
VSHVAGVDLGGTKVAVALFDKRQRIVDRVRVPTPAGGPQAVIAAIVEAVRALPEAPDAVGIGAPGPINDGVVKTAPNLPGWSEPVPLAALLSERLGVPTVVDNDANVGAVGEWVAGAGRGARFLLGVWLGTGVGGGLVLDGKPYRGAFGGAGEFGHMCVHLGGALCSCGRRGCVEAYAGRASMERMISAAVAAGRETKLEGLRSKSGKERYTSGVWAKALKGGDPLASEVLGEAVGALGAALGAAVNLLDLDRVVIGGGLAEKLGQELVDRINAATRPYVLVDDVERPVVLAELADDAGVVGAASLARSLLAVPVPG